MEWFTKPDDFGGFFEILERKGGWPWGDEMKIFIFDVMKQIGDGDAALAQTWRKAAVYVHRVVRDIWGLSAQTLEPMETRSKYPDSLKDSILAMKQAGEDWQGLCRAKDVKIGVAKRWMADKPPVFEKKKPGPVLHYDDNHAKIAEELVEEIGADATLKELCGVFYDVMKVECERCVQAPSTSTMHNMLEARVVTMKNLVICPRERNSESTKESRKQYVNWLLEQQGNYFMVFAMRPPSTYGLPEDVGGL